MSDLVLFSGGCDSTLVLYRRAMEHLQNRSGCRVRALSINHEQVAAQKQQQAARAKVKKAFEERQLPVEWLDVSICQTANTQIHSSGITQPVVWLPTASLYLCSGDTLYTGYHRGDDFWMFKDKAEIAFINFLAVMEKTSVQIKHELQLLTKCEIIRELKDRGLYELCWYCESPTTDDKPCGNCDPCRTHRTALWQMENLGNIEPTAPCLPLPSLILSDPGIGTEVPKLSGS